MDYKANRKPTSAIFDFEEVRPQGQAFFTPDDIKRMKEPRPEPASFKAYDHQVKITRDLINSGMLRPSRQMGKSVIDGMMRETIERQLHDGGLLTGITHSAGAARPPLTADDIRETMEAMKKAGGAASVAERMTLAGRKMTGMWIDEYGILDPAEMSRMMSVNYPSRRLDKEDEMALSKKGPALSPEAIAELEKLADKMNDRLQLMAQSGRRVTLAGPGNMTVMRPAGFGKRNHIGGEEFIVDSVYVGSPKTGSRLIFKLRPTAVSDYEHMEMNQADCERGLNDWRTVVDCAAGGNFYVELEKVRTIDFAKLQAQENQRLAAEYQEFGAW